MDMTTCVARRTRSRTESYLNSILNKSKGISESEGTLNSRTRNKRGVSLRDACSPSPRKKKPRRRKVSEDDNDDDNDDGDVEFVRTDYPEGKREGVDGDNVGSNSVGLESKSLDCGDRVCDFDLDDVNLRGEEKTSNFDLEDDVVFVGTIPGDNEHVEGDNVGSPRVCVDDGDLRGEEKGSTLNPLSPDGDVVFIPGEKEHVEDGNVGSGICDILLNDILKGSEFDDVKGGSVEDLGTDSGEEFSGQDRDSGESDSDGEDADSDSSDYVVGSSDSSDVDSSDGDFVCSEDEEAETIDVAKEKKSPTAS
ncbi:PREDICTED: SNF2 domain-containing protein CLASSY 4-like [Camelina sativa]|uniref:SNF2 domain-containing protein CLASSY 4-like n=1 Tax=Camelina sativa TaxID=90675 RepID=A0ABM0WB71_CAMSA|nr:PREDICTED: SNF2 domain-containing protein CLASSY 4-like [Camelina sativa]